MAVVFSRSEQISYYFQLGYSFINGILLMLNFTFLMDGFFELFASCLSMNATNESSHA